MNTDTKNILRIIRFTPILAALFLSILIITILYNEYENEFNKEKLFMEKQYIELEKDRIKTNINSIHNSIKKEKIESEKILKEDLKQRMDVVHKMITNIYNKNKNRLSKDEIIIHIKNAIEPIRFNEGRGYFSIHTMEGVNILQPMRPEYEGTSVLNRQDSRGHYSVRDAIEIAKTKKEGFLTWYSIKPNDRLKEYKKIGIIKKFEPYNLIITTAEFVDDFEKKLQKKILNNLSRLIYKNDGFVTVINYEGEILLHKVKKVLNHNIFKEEKFSHVSSFFKELISNEDKEHGDFISIKPTVTLGKDTKELKVTYSKKFDDWNWIISLSFRMSELNKFIEERKNIYEDKYLKHKKDVLTFSIIATIILLILSFFVAKLIEIRFLNYKKTLEDQKDTLLRAQKIAKIGEYELDIETEIAYWSDSMIKIFGVEGIKETPGPKLLQKIVYDEDWNCFISSIKKCKEQKVEHLCRYRIKRPLDDKTVWIECRGELTKDNKLIGTVQDITQSKLIEIEKEEKERLLYQQSKMASMGEMIGNIAHQWRQPLSIISTAATGAKLQKEMDCLSDYQLNSSLEAINNSAQYLSQTIDDFRNFFNPNNNYTNEFNIEDTLNKSLKLVESQFTAKNIEIIKDIESHELLSIENELIQVIINILNNAKDALILKEVKIKLIFINIYKEKNNLYIEVLDNAGGIKENIIDKIFEPYFTTKNKSQGTGIGLYMSYDIVKNHLSGTLYAENISFSHDNIEYKGAKFTLVLPLN